MQSSIGGYNLYSHAKQNNFLYPVIFYFNALNLFSRWFMHFYPFENAREVNL